MVEALNSMQEIASSQDSQSKLLNFYVSDLLCMAEIDNRKFKKHLSSFNVRQAIDQVVEVQRGFSEPKDVTVEIQFDENQADTIDGDEFRLQQVLMKLLSNAIKFSLEGGKVTIICQLEAEALGITKVGIKVVDEGVGISIEDQAKLFKLFGFVEQIQDDLNTQGLGMGLYIAKLISEQFDGGVSVESELGRGSTFGFTMLF